MKLFSFLLLVIIVVLLLALEKSVAIRPPSTVYVNKCCRIDEWLNENHHCMIGGTKNWWPLIVLTKKQSYFEPNGSAPRFFKIKEHSHPFCDKPEFFDNQHSIALFSNGSLYLSEKLKIIEPKDFCVDKDVAIVCDPERNTADASVFNRKLTKIRKCCGRNAVYNASVNTCAHINSSLSTEQILTNSTHVDFVFGFPHCKISKYFTISERFHESNIDMDTGRLILQTGRKLESKNYCLEYVLDANSIDELSMTVNVFTCADHLSSASNDALSISDTVM